MKKRLLAISILVCGLLLIAYGVATASVSNKSEIFSRYDCNRITKDFRSTDKYCSDPSSAPEATRDFVNSFVYTGAAIAILGGLYFYIVLSSKKTQV